MAQQVQTEGFQVPPAGGPAPKPANPAAATPGFVQNPAQPTVPVLPATAQSFTQADIDAAVQAALAKQTAPPAPASVAPLVSPAAAIQVGNSTYTNDGTGDPVLNSFTNVFMAVGKDLDMDRAFGKALQYGNPGLIDAAYINEKGGANAAQLLTTAQAIVQRVQEQTQTAAAAIHNKAGGKEQWDAAAAAFNKNAPAHIKQVISTMLNSGNADAVQSAAQSVVDYSKQNGLVSTPAGLVQAGVAGVNAANAISKAEFQAAHMRLDPNSRTYIEDRNALYARRQMGKSMGK